MFLFKILDECSAASSRRLSTCSGPWRLANFYHHCWMRAEKEKTEHFSPRRPSEGGGGFILVQKWILRSKDTSLGKVRLAPVGNEWVLPKAVIMRFGLGTFGDSELRINFQPRGGTEGVSSFPAKMRSQSRIALLLLILPSSLLPCEVI